MQQKKVLIINADDFGISPGVSQGMINLYQKGVLSSVSVMVNMPGTQHAIQLLHENQGLGFGLHFNLTEGLPISQNTKSLLSTEGAFLTRKKIILNSFLGLINKNEIKTELEAQFNLIKNAGLHPDHIDGHQHIHAVPGIFKIVLDFAAEKKLPVRLPLAQNFRASRFFSTHILNSFLPTKKNLPVPANDTFSSIFDLNPYASTLQDYSQLLDIHPGVHELMVHPYAMDDQLRIAFPGNIYAAKQKFLQAANREYEMMMIPEFSNLIQSGDFTLTTWALAFAAKA